jgi:Domain of unknown function (DUF4411)
MHLLDASVLITAHNTYYPIDRVPEFWEWLVYQGTRSAIKLPREIIEEVLAGEREDDLLLEWLKKHKAILIFDANADPGIVQYVVSTGYADDLTDQEIEQVGRDPFLIAYALEHGHCVVTTEVSKPSKQRQNRHVPDVCKDLDVECCGPFALNKQLNFHTGWKPE